MPGDLATDCQLFLIADPTCISHAQVCSQLLPTQPSQKLTRRQKSFELIAGRLSTEDFDKFRVILSRDYTSSDEEFEDCSASAAATASAGAPLRVRELPWESAEMAEMKRQLDTAYLDSCATAKQSEQLRRVARGTGCLSVRPPPADCPDWAIRRETADPGDLGNADC
ncbi:hypothetical protein BOX15_Mlig022797g1 [Macrostomum lignano]|uniref:Uncharacterized protein n=1 Tax=Macrostomum lignano TaxID=282301 RepID=A0A267G893_9PLAT|nr:hypothetical protein BOX15_Mlig022797g1 [Macrostomum lignano]